MLMFDYKCQHLNEFGGWYIPLNLKETRNSNLLVEIRIYYWIFYSKNILKSNKIIFSLKKKNAKSLTAHSQYILLHMYLHTSKQTGKMSFWPHKAEDKLLNWGEPSVFSFGVQPSWVTVNPIGYHLSSSLSITQPFSKHTLSHKKEFNQIIKNEENNMFALNSHNLKRSLSTDFIGF